VVVTEGQTALITRFGRPVRAATDGGLHWKLPWPIDQTSLMDMRRRVYETGDTEMLTRDKKNVIARTFVVWRIGDPLTFAQSIGGEGGAESKLDGLLTNAAIGTLGGHDLSALVSTNPADLQVDQIESELMSSTSQVAMRSYGVAIDQIRINGSRCQRRTSRRRSNRCAPSGANLPRDSKQRANARRAASVPRSNWKRPK
jgi:membrane protease subunit HflC